MDEIKSNLVILEVAERIFFQYGYSNTSMEEIANECGMSKKTIYKHFTSKEEMLIECVKRKIDYNSKKIPLIPYYPIETPWTITCDYNATKGFDGAISGCCNLSSVEI